MRYRYPLLVAATLLGGCRPQSSESAREPIHAADSVGPDSDVTGAVGVEYEAPRLIPGMLALLDAVTDSAGRIDEGTMTGYKQAVGTLVDGMLTDLNRVGVGEDGEFRALGDSAVNLLGGGTGVPDAAPEEVQRSAAMMRRLIDKYNQRMRAAQS